MNESSRLFAPFAVPAQFFNWLPSVSSDATGMKLYTRCAPHGAFNHSLACNAGGCFDSVIGWPRTYVNDGGFV